jgi:carboxyl-terminal processing protease
MGTPAAVAGLKPDDWVRRIDRKPLDDLSEEAVAERLRGPAGSPVELEVLSMGDAMPRTVTLTRQVIHLPSVVQVQMLPDQVGIGYFHIVSFQKTTVQELDEALLQLKMQGLKVLIVDLRGNGGGVFLAAVQVTERFLPEGKVIVSTQGHLPDQVRMYKSGYAGALDVPLVVLIDGETASAAEVVAGALKDHGRARLVGQPTFGKASVQRIVPLETSGAGIRVTLARFLPPGGHSYNVVGVDPDVPEPRTPSMTDNQLRKAVAVALQLSGAMGQ